MIQERKPTGGTPPYTDENSSEIKRDIDRTRADMDETLDSLSERLQPRHLLDDVLSMFRGRVGGEGGTSTGRQVADQLLDRVKSNPLPAALIGAGIAWLLMEERRPARRYPTEPQGPMHSGSYVDARTGRAYGPGEPGAEQHLPPQSGASGSMYSGSYVDARTGREYDPSYGQEFREGESGEGRLEGLSEQAKERASGAAESAKEAGSQAAHKAGEWAESAKSGMYGAAGSARDAASSAGHRLSEGASYAGHQMREGAYYAGHQMREGTQYLGEQLRYGYHYSKRTVVQAIDEYPLAMGVAAMAAGLAIGLLVPESRREDELMGPERDDLWRRAKNRGKAMADRGKHAAQAATAAGLEEARAEGLTPRDLTDKAGQVATETAEAAQESAKEEGITPGQLKEKAEHVAEAAQEAAQEEMKTPEEKEKKEGPERL